MSADFYITINLITRGPKERNEAIVTLTYKHITLSSFYVLTVHAK